MIFKGFKLLHVCRIAFGIFLHFLNTHVTYFVRFAFILFLEVKALIKKLKLIHQHPG